MDNYYKAIKELAKQLGNIRNESKTKVQNMITSYFTRNITTELKLELAKAKLTNVQDMVNYIQEQENIVIAEYHAGKIFKHQLLSIDNPKKSTNIFKPAKKYCKFHKVNSHSG